MTPDELLLGKVFALETLQTQVMAFLLARYEDAADRELFASGLGTMVENLLPRDASAGMRQGALHTTNNLIESALTGAKALREGM